MSSTTTDSEEGIPSKDQADSPSFDEGSCGGSLGGGTVLKKGPWTSAEDAILVDYVKKHGEGNWNAVQKHSGLSRCGKSCRLRWANHLRPNLKKGAFTSEEEHLIIELHAKMGNKWARMAAHLPGRTDNEIKNYWNTRIKRRQRAGLPLYPPDVCLQALHDHQQAPTTSEFNGGDAHHVMQSNNFDIPEVVFDHLKSNQSVLSYVPPLPDMIGSMMNQGLGSSQNFNFMSATLHRPKRIRGSEILFPGYGSSVSNGFSPVDQLTDSRGKINQHYGLSFPYDPDPNGKQSSTFGLIPGSHALLNGNFSTSKPLLGSPKSELPSLQYPETDLGSWGTSSPQPPSVDSVDAFIQSPSPTRLVPSDCLSPRNSGLLDALLHESQTLSCAKNQSSEKSSNSNSCVVTPGDIGDSSAPNICETEWEEFGDPISPLGRSAASVFNERTPLSGSSFDDHPAPAASPVLSAGSEIKKEPMEHVTTPEEGTQLLRHPNFARPDVLLDGGWFCGKDQSFLCDPLPAFIGEDICQMSAQSTISHEGWGVSSYPWNNLPPVCQMSELP